MSVLSSLRRLFDRSAQPAQTPEAVRPAAPAETSSRLTTFLTADTDSAITAMSADELLAWENQSAPSVVRDSDAAEATADERQDAITSLNFPLHWSSASSSWNYLFDLAVACDLLAPRPDDRVLDLAAGTCWATEFLLRLGVRTVSIDLSFEMMRRGRERLAADSRLVFRDDASFVAARGQSLPFASDSFDGVMCLNALHHHPSYAEVLREIYRVLKPGGRAVFSEPGMAHAANPLSMFRMREEGVIEKSVSLAAVRRLALDAGFSRMRVVPLRSASDYAFDYAAGDADVASLDTLWQDTLRHVAREHARFVLHKGGDPVADTLLPAQKLAGRLGALIELDRVTGTARSGRAFVDHVRITNSGSVVWRARGRRFGGQVTVGLKVCDEHNEVLREDLGRTWLPRDIAPGESVEIEMTVDGALSPGRYRLRYDMVVEGVTWFEFQGSPCAHRPLDITD